MMRCNAELTIQVPGTTVRVDIWPGLEVDVDREIAPASDTRPAVTIASAVAGLEHYFEPIAKAPRPERSKKTEE